MKRTTLADLPPELLDQIVAYLPTTETLSNLARSSRALESYADQSAWAIFARTRFPTVVPAQAHDWKQTVRSLTTRSRAWDRRAIVARFIEPGGVIRTFPGGKTLDRWKRPTGQTVGFTPRLDAYSLDDLTNESTDVLAYSAGAQIVIKKQTRHIHGGRRHATDVQWSTYRPFSAAEGRDDISVLHLLSQSKGPLDEQHVITGTANGDLQHLGIPFGSGERRIYTYFTTQGQAVRSSSLDTQNGLLAVSLGQTQLAIYKVDAGRSKSAPISVVDTDPVSVDGVRNKVHRTWSTQFLPQNRLAVGFGPSTEPLRIYEVLPSGFSSGPVRTFQLHDTVDGVDVSGQPGLTPHRVIKSSVYPIIPVPGQANLLFSGAYDGLIRMHDMRSPRAAELIIQDGYDDSAIYSLYLRGQETLIAGTSRHSHLKVFDARLGAKAYSYLDMTDGVERPAGDFSLYLSTRASWHVNRYWRTDGSIYSLASPNPSSPYIYAGVQNGVIELASTEILHKRPDPLYFEPWPGEHDKPSEWNGWPAKSLLNIARYEAGKMNGQKNLWDTWQTRHAGTGDGYLDARWNGVKSIDLD